MAHRIAFALVLVAEVFALACRHVALAEAPMDRGSRRPAHHTDDGFRNPGGGPGHGDTPLSVALPFFARRVVASVTRADYPAAPRAVSNDGEFLREYIKTWQMGNDCRT